MLIETGNDHLPCKPPVQNDFNKITLHKISYDIDKKTYKMFQKHRNIEKSIRQVIKNNCINHSYNSMR